jgi:aminotransferase
MTRLISTYHPDDGINLAQGFPDFSAPQILKDAACDAIQEDINQYAITWGAKAFRDGIAEKSKRFLDLDADPETEITVTCGATEAMISSMLAIMDPTASFQARSLVLFRFGLPTGRSTATSSRRRSELEPGPSS